MHSRRVGPRGYHLPMTVVRAVMWERAGRWFGRMHRDGSVVNRSATTQDACVKKLAALTTEGEAIVVEVAPALVGVSEAAEILGWDRRRIVTYVDRGSFPQPIAALASGRVWRRSDVQDFARAWHGSHPERVVPPGAA